MPTRRGRFQDDGTELGAISCDRCSMLRAAISALAMLVFATTAFAEECLVGTRLLNFDETMASCTELIRRDPTNAEAYAERGRLHAMSAMVSGNIDEHNRAIADFTQAIAIDPNDPNLYYDRGLEHEAIKEFQLAITDFRRMLDLIQKHHPRARDSWKNQAIDALKRLNAYP